MKARITVDGDVTQAWRAHVRRELAERGHLPLIQGNAIECSRCGQTAGVSLTMPAGGPVPRDGSRLRLIVNLRGALATIPRCGG